MAAGPSGLSVDLPEAVVRLALFLLAVPVVALLATVSLPFVNGPHLWFGLPSMLVWSVAWVLTVTPALAFVEHRRRTPADPGER
ncbi:hypothetical protein ACQPZF_23795 [Actinosynnema sp. CS-041913]|uniref:hypothetical protein n=1 Tax=Actinosynnema sp. CS-041913 TaxID=3239917 RepID=UPI003D8D2AD0